MNRERVSLDQLRGLLIAALEKRGLEEASHFNIRRLANETQHGANWTLETFDPGEEDRVKIVAALQNAMRDLQDRYDID